jgi:hypothetical protein
LKIASKFNRTNFDNSKLRNSNIEKVQYEIAIASKNMWKRTSRKIQKWKIKSKNKNSIGCYQKKAQSWNGKSFKGKK